MTDDVLIMQFLGYRIIKNRYVNCLEWDCDKGTPLENKIKGRLVVARLEFNTDWNWLMIAIKKLSDVITHEPGNKMPYYLIFNEIDRLVIYGDIKKTYSNVIKLIKLLEHDINPVVDYYC